MTLMIPDLELQGQTLICYVYYTIDVQTFPTSTFRNVSSYTHPILCYLDRHSNQPPNTTKMQ